MFRPPRGFRLAVVLATALAVVVAAVGVWSLWLRGVFAAARADADSRTYLSGCLDPGFTGVRDGVQIAIITLPGSPTGWPVRQGVGGASLRDSVGWYDQTARPGQVGNMVLVGQRLATGGPFDAILDIKAGDAITVETCQAVYTYTVRVAPSDLTVQPTDTWVMDAVPGRPAAMPSTAWLTLVANQDVLPTSDRAVGFAELTATTAR